MAFKNKTAQKIISFVLVVGMITPVILFSIPKKLNAQLGPCVTAAGPCASEVVQVKRSFLQILMHVLLGSSAASNAVTATQTTASTLIKIKEWAAKILADVLKGIAKNLLAEMTQSTVNWINSGFHGKPLFLQNPESFFKNVAKSEIKKLINTFGYNSLRFPFGKAFAINTINSYKSTLENNAQYTLSRVINDPAFLERYRNDFSVGGWNGFIINTQYPQNNYLGFQILAAEELSRRTQEYKENKVQEVKKKLDQGAGFLSPQICATRPSYNNFKNEFQQPNFKPTTPYAPGVALKDFIPPPEPEKPYDYDYDMEVRDAYDRAIHAYPEQLAIAKKKFLDRYDATWEKQNAADKAIWALKNECPNKPDGSSGFENATPGSVVANQIMTAISSTYRQKELAGALGNSLSAIFDALLNKFIGSGLNALSNKISGIGSGNDDDKDDFDYYGNTLGTSNTNNNGNSDVFGGADIIITLSDLKKTVQNAIEKTSLEIKLINNEDAVNPGIVQVISKIWPKIRELDICVPGPDLDWEKRVDTEKQTNAQKIQLGISTGSTENSTQAEFETKTKKADEATAELEYAAKAFKDWIKNKIKSELSGAGSYLEGISRIETLNQEYKDLIAIKTAKADLLNRLESIQADLAGITTEPDPDTEEEKNLIDLKKRYDTTTIDPSVITGTAELQSQLDTAKVKLASLSGSDGLIAQCGKEREEKGWSSAGGRKSVFKETSKPDKTEQEIFCSLPAVGGYSHKSFINPKTPTHPEIPLLNADNVLEAPTETAAGVTNIRMSCNAIFKGTVADYKKDLPGALPAEAPEELVDDTN